MRLEIVIKITISVLTFFMILFNILLKCRIELHPRFVRNFSRCSDAVEKLVHVLVNTVVALPYDPVEKEGRHYSEYVCCSVMKSSTSIILYRRTTSSPSRTTADQGWPTRHSTGKRMGEFLRFDDSNHDSSVFLTQMSQDHSQDSKLFLYYPQGDLLPTAPAEGLHLPPPRGCQRRRAHPPESQTAGQ